MGRKAVQIKPLRARLAPFITAHNGRIALNVVRAEGAIERHRLDRRGAELLLADLACALLPRSAKRKMP